MLKNISKIFIIHYDKLLDRKKYLIDYFLKNNIDNFEFRNLYQREYLTDNIKNYYFKFNNLTPDLNNLTPDLNNLNPAQICITIEHIETYREIITNCLNENDWYLILEDDAIFCDNFIEKLNCHMENIPTDAEYLDICDYFTITGNNVWDRQYVTRTNCSYLIKKKTCEKLLNTIIPFEFAIDLELNKQITIHGIKTYWSTQSLVHGGSGSHYSASYSQYR
jgi:hypothetical protein